MATQAERDEARFRRLVDVNSSAKAFQKTDESQRKPLFGRANSANNTVDKGTFGGAQTEGSPVAGTEDATRPTSRIPRRSSQSPDVASRSSPFRKGGAGAVKLTDAWKMTAPKEEEDVLAIHEKQGSPSPAPRPRPKFGSREEDEKRMAKIREASRRVATPPAQDARQKSMDEDLTTGTSASGGSLSESLGSLAGGDDSTIEQKLAHHKRYLARKESILQKQIPLFAKNDQGSSGLPRKSSVSSLEGEPKFGQRRSDWGRKARIGTGWMRKIVSPDDSGELPEAPKLLTQDMSVDWAGAAADVPLASVEDGNSRQEPTPPHSRPSSAQPQTASPLKSQDSDIDLDFSVDFTAKSVLYSNSPALNARGSKIDEIRQREIESLNKRAVATSRLEDIRERNSAERSASPEVTRSPAREGSLRSTTSQSSLRRESEVSSRVDSAALSRRASERSLRKESTERVVVPEATKAAIGEAEAVDKSQSAKEDSHRRSLSKEGISAALTPGPKLRRIPSPNESSEPPKQSKTMDSDTGSAASSKLPLPPAADPEIYHEKTILEEEGEHIPGTPITIFYGAAKDKPAHTRGGSWEDLQRLSRLLSESPAGSSEQKKPTDASSKLSQAIPLDVKRLSTTSTPPKSDVDPEERIAAEASLFDLPENNKSERNSLRAPSPDSYSDSVEATPVPKPNPLSMPTPVVIGAYIDTPAPTLRQSRRSARASTPADDVDDTGDETARIASNIATREFVRSQRAEPSQSRSVSSGISRDRSDPGPLSSHPVNNITRGRSAGRFRPRLINTANPASVADDLRKIQQEAQIEDSTLDDFDELLGIDDDSDPNSTTLLAPAIDFEKDDRGRPLSEKERERRLEAAAYERLNKGLKNGLLSIRDAKRGIERLEDQVSLSADLAALVPNSDRFGSLGVVPSDSNVVAYIAIPIPRLWTWDVTKRWGFHLTWLGIIAGILFSWFVTETVVCEFICRPTYASINTWQPGDPEWGAALPTLVDRWTGGFVNSMGTLVGGFLTHIWALWTDSDMKQAGENVLSAGREAFNNWEGGSMFEDEAL